jgi:GNAT superfamily N-acetyltransferase
MFVRMSMPAHDVQIRPLRESELAEASLICRVAFGTFLGIPEPHNAGLDREYIATRWRAAPDAVLAAELDGALAGTNVATNWGSFAFFGPLTVRPELWNRGIAQKLLAPTMDLFESWGVKDAGLFTFAHSAKHATLYQKFGFWPRFLTAIMSKAVTAAPASSFQKFSALDDAGRSSALARCREITNAILDGLDVSKELLSVLRQSLGDTIILDGDAFAVCHFGPGTEAANSTCYVKFAAVRPGPRAEKVFEKLLDAITSLAQERGLLRIEAGTNLGRSGAYRAMLRSGFKTQMQGVAMHKPDRPIFSRPDVFAIDDWR